MRSNLGSGGVFANLNAEIVLVDPARDLRVGRPCEHHRPTNGQGGEELRRNHQPAPLGSQADEVHVGGGQTRFQSGLVGERGEHDIAVLGRDGATELVGAIAAGGEGNRDSVTGFGPAGTGQPEERFERMGSTHGARIEEGQAGPREQRGASGGVDGSRAGGPRPVPRGRGSPGGRWLP